ncbi:hypothetical protein PINS_up006662 [Pythium insidiosum]|nr:hypothetical protein PINS_up006662 [Pythium insidiosum]
MTTRGLRDEVFSTAGKFGSYHAAVDTKAQAQDGVVDTEIDPAVQRIRRRRVSQAEAVHGLITGLANELMTVMDKNQSHRIEWFEFRQHLDYLQQRIDETKRFIRDHILV